jgi:hypothetical protein
MKIEAKPSEYKIEGLKVRDFFDDRFVKLLEGDIKNLKFEHTCFTILGKKEGEEKESVVERLAINHEVREDEERGITSIGATKSETCELFLKIVEEFIKEKGIGD